MENERLLVLGTNIHVTDYDGAIQTILRWIKRKESTFVCFVNAYALMSYQRDMRLLKGVNTAGLIVCDGMPLVWLGRLYGKMTTRVYGTTLVRKLCERAVARHLTIFLLGGQQGQSKDILSALMRLYPGIAIVGVWETPDRPISISDNRRIIRDIWLTRPDIILIGLGCPHQERWILANRHRLPPAVCMGVGSTFDFISGWKKEAPLWMQMSGTEWIYRFIQEPRRLWYRYTVMNAQFVWRIAKQFVHDMFSGVL